jgi:hypothetical protein
MADNQGASKSKEVRHNRGAAHIICGALNQVLLNGVTRRGTARGNPQLAVD